jgi:hypothetical protein
MAAAVTPDKPWLELYRYWLDKHVDGWPPARRDLDPPLEIPSLLARLMLIELDGDEFRYRLVGSDIAQYLAVNVTGKIVGGNKWAPDHIRSEWRRMIATVSERQRPHMAITMPGPGNTRTGFCLALPLVDKTGATEQILIGIFSDRQAFGSSELEGIDVFEFEP